MDEVFMPIQLNWFRLDFSPAQLQVPTRFFTDWESSSSALAGDLKEYGAVRWRDGEGRTGRVAVGLLNGPAAPSDCTSETVNIYERRSVAKRLSHDAIAHYFTRRNLNIQKTRFDLLVMRPEAEFSEIGVALSTGIRLRFFQPEGVEMAGFVVNWEVQAQFVRALDDPVLRRLCVGMPVIFMPTNGQVVPGLHEYTNRFIGDVTEVVDDKTIKVWTRDDQVVVVPAASLRLEAKPAVMRELERQHGLREQARSVFRRIQDLKLVLKNGRRNLNVLRDQLRSIRGFFSPDAGDSIVMPARFWTPASIALQLVPAEVEVRGTL
jgi:hypothetical protein